MKHRAQQLSQKARLVRVELFLARPGGFMFSFELRFLCMKIFDLSSSHNFCLSATWLLILSPHQITMETVAAYLVRVYFNLVEEGGGWIIFDKGYN